MPIDYIIGNGRVLTTGQGVVTFEEIYQMALCQRKDPAFRGHFDELLDLTQIEALQLSEAELQRIAAVSPFGNGSRRAIAVTQDLHYGLSRMYEAFQESQGAKMRVFRSLPAALAWLDGSEADSEVL
jgi:hypothetical protein